MTSDPLFRVFRRTALPLGCYYAITLGLPLANGAGQSGAIFAKHALIVFVVPLLLILVACAVHTIVHGWFVRRHSDVVSGFPPPPKAPARLAEARYAREGGGPDGAAKGSIANT